MMALTFATPSLPSLHGRFLRAPTHLALPLAAAGAFTNPLHSYAAVCIRTKASRLPLVTAALPPLDLTEENVKQVLVDARSEFEQMFDSSVGITGKAELAELDGPFVKISLQGRFWHKRSTVLDRLGTYLKNRIPEILEVEIEDEKQLDDSPENF